MRHKFTCQSVLVNMELTDRKMPTMRGGPLKDDEFQFENVQFRWGPCNSRGAEHSINNVWLEKFSVKIQNKNSK